MQTNYYTLWTLLSDSEIKYVQVPIIQRDYAQGRVDEKATGIRNRLIEALYEALAQQQPLTLDFVYGELRRGLFVPLDGQQRLTTLFLLHWYLAMLDGRLPEAQAALSKFTYETRSSSREFCEKLVTKPAPMWKEYATLSMALRDTTWYQPAWERDPTVAAMLTMLDALSARFGKESGWFERLINTAQPLIGFYFLDMPQVGLTDDLYLKMNARGKPLTNFENWKAEFDLLLQRQGMDELQAEFGRKMDGDWTDFFWKYRKEGSAVIDDAMEQYLHYLTRMLAYREGENDPELAESRLSFRWFEQVYAQQENVVFLFRTLDFLVEAGQSEDSVAGLLRKLLSEQVEPERVRLFGNSQTDIFRQCLQELNPNQRLQEQVLVFGLLTYGATVASEQFSEPDVRDLLRIIRNLLERVRQQNDTKLNSNLRAENLPAFAAAVTALGTAEAGASPQVYKRLANGLALSGIGRRGIEHEREKAHLLATYPNLKQALQELEDQAVFRGDLHNLRLTEYADQVTTFGQAVREIWSGTVSQELIIRAWLTQGDYRISQEKWTRLGEKFFFGNDADWYTVLATDLVSVQRNLLPAFLLAYLAASGVTPVDKLTHLTTSWLAKKPNRNWRYYFVKYPEMTENSQGYYAWASNFEMRLLRGTSLKSKHINSYVHAVVRRGRVATALAPGNEQWVHGDWESPLWLKNIPGMPVDSWDMSLHSEMPGWRLSLPEGYTLPVALEKEYGLEPNADGWRWLRKTSEYDRIEQAENFIVALQLQGVKCQA